MGGLPYCLPHFVYVRCSSDFGRSSTLPTIQTRIVRCRLWCVLTHSITVKSNIDHAQEGGSSSHALVSACLPISLEDSEDEPDRVPNEETPQLPPRESEECVQVRSLVFGPS